MDDEKIVAMFWERDEAAIAEAKKKYGRYCRSIAFSILHSDEDADECENEAYLDAWNSIPPEKPEKLSAFLGRLTRRNAIDRIRKKFAGKRGNGEAALTLDELEECAAQTDAPDERVIEAELSRLIDTFLRSLPETERNVFIRRYWYMDSIDEIAVRFGFSQSKVKSMLMRTRKKLSAELKKGNYCYEN